MTTKKEFRFSEFTCEKRGEGETQGQVLVGYAAKFDKAVEIGGLFREVIRRGAFKRAIEEGQDVRALIDHNPSLILGRTKANTLNLTEDETGLRVEITLGETNTAKDISASIARGDVDQMSFGFVVKKQTWVAGQNNDLTLREIQDVDLFDVSVVTYPAYEDTQISVRSDAESILTEYTKTIQAEIDREKFSIDLLEIV